MKKADLHVHSRFSEHPSEWFLQRLGTRESYTDIEKLYRDSLQRGMDFVTITDHNRMDGVLELKRKYPQTVFTGVEATTYFPEDGCKIHILIYGLSESQFAEVEYARKDIYMLRSYLKGQKLPYSVAHATFSVNKKLTVEHVYKLLLLFDHFETENGARTKRANTDFLDILISLNPDHMEDLRQRYGIEPFSDESWRKGFTGGSDDHCGLTVGQTYTTVKDAGTPEEFLKRVMDKSSFTGGKSNDYRGFAFSIYKIVCDFSKEKSSAISSTLFSTINRMLFEGYVPGLKNRIAITRMKMMNSHNGTDSLKGLLSGVLSEIERLKKGTMDEKFDAVYNKITDLSDELFRSYFTAIEGSIENGDLSRLVRALSGVLPVAFLSLPFISTINIMNESRAVQEKLDRRFGTSEKGKRKRIAWFTDTIADLNGPSETIQKLAWTAFYQDYDLIPVVCLLPEEKKTLLPPNVLDLPAVWSFTPPFFSLYTLRVPSLLGSIRMITEEEPDEVLISTPGPVGLFGLLIARLLHIPCKGIYHTDFSQQAACITGDETVCRILEDYVRWFYRMCSEIKVPTREYIRILEERGYNPDTMSLFKRGIESDQFTPMEDARSMLADKYHITKNGIRLLFAGRISTEKQVDMLLPVFEAVQKKYPDTSLIFAGNGPEPYYSEFRKIAASYQQVHFLGRLKRSQLPLVYSGSDLLLFPGTTDTFGMVVLEAQACGLPALVADIGGPQEIITDKITGYVLPALNVDIWVSKIADVINMINSFPEQYLEMRMAARELAIKRYNWQSALNDLFGITDVPDRNGRIYHRNRETEALHAKNDFSGNKPLSY